MNLEELLNVDEKEYCNRFSDQNFGFELANHIVKKHSAHKIAERINQGSSLVFKLENELFLKITPPFYSDSFDAEIQASKLVEGHLPFDYPEIEFYGELGRWRYLVSKPVAGEQAFKVYGKLNEYDRIQIASDLGLLIKSYSNVETKGFDRKFGPWNVYLEDRITNQEDIHIKKGNSISWVKKICQFVDFHANDLKNLSNPVLVHADFNREHILLDCKENRYKVVGILDLADSMVAPIETEFILPFMEFFRGNFSHQTLLMSKAGYDIPKDREKFSKVMLALTLQNRFIAFQDWFMKEIKEGIDSLDDLAFKVFPPQ